MGLPEQSESFSPTYFHKLPGREAPKNTGGEHPRHQREPEESPRNDLGGSIAALRNRDEGTVTAAKQLLLLLDTLPPVAHTEFTADRSLPD